MHNTVKNRVVLAARARLEGFLATLVSTRILSIHFDFIQTYFIRDETIHSRFLYVTTGSLPSFPPMIPLCRSRLLLVHSSLVQRLSQTHSMILPPQSL
jgi:hypothetical protein